MKTPVQIKKEELKVQWPKERKAELRAKMREAMKNGIDPTDLATCPESYSIAMKIKYN